MFKLTRETKTGLTVVLAIVIFIWGYSFIKNDKLFDSSRQFFAVYDNVQGLGVSSVVTINGLKVGKVDNINFSPKQKGKLIVSFSLENNFKFSKNSIAKIYSSDLIGTKSLSIIPVFSNKLAVSGDTLKSEVEPGVFELLNNKIAPLQSKIESLVSNTDIVMRNFNKVLDSSSIVEIRSSISNLDATLLQIKSVSRSANEIVKEQKSNISKITLNSVKITSNLAQISDSIAKANLGKTVQNLQSSLNKFNNILTNLNNGEGTAGKLLHDEALYNNLSNASKQLEEFIKDIKLNPKRYFHFSIFGKKPKPYTSEDDKKDDKKDK